MGAQGTAGVNFDGAVTSVDAISGNPTCGTPYTLGGAKNEDGFWKFNFTIDTFNGGS